MYLPSSQFIHTVPINHQFPDDQSKLVGGNFSASLSILAVSIVLMEPFCIISDIALSSYTTLGLISLMFGLIVVEYEALCHQIKSDWVILLSLPGILESLSLVLSVGWLFNTLNSLFITPSSHSLSIMFPYLFSMLSFLNFLGWVIFPFLGFLPLSRMVLF